MKLQTINIGGAACAIVPLKDYDLLQEALEDAAEEEALRLGRADETIPMSMADRLYQGNPVRVWREYRDMTATELAAAAGISKSELSAMENGESSGSVAAFRRVVNALQVAVDDLLG